MCSNPALTRSVPPWFPLSHMGTMRKYCGRGGTHIEILKDLIFLNTPVSEKAVFGVPCVCLSVCICVSICTPFAPERLNGTYSVFKSSSVLDQGSGIMKILHFHSSTALQPFVWPWPILLFRIFFAQLVGLLGRMVSPSQGRNLPVGQHKHRINTHTNIHALSGIRNHDPSVRSGEDNSCLKPSHCDRLSL
jgi:hypothetical protein